MHVLLITLIDDPFDPPGLGRFGGGHYFIFDLARHLVRQGDAVTLITRLNREGKALRQQISPALNIHRLAVGPPEDIKGEDVGTFLPELKKGAIDLLTGLSFDAVHSQYWVSGIVALAWSKATSTRHVHAPLSFGRRKKAEGLQPSVHAQFRDVCELEIFTSADWLVVTSPDEREALRRLYPEVENENIALVPYGVDTELFHPRPGSPDHYLRRQARNAGKGP